MKKYFYVIFFFFLGVLIMYTYKVQAILPLSGKIIVIDPGHGMEDPGASYGNIYEKDINLSISLYLEKELSKLGASVILTRDGDYDLSTPNALHRKKSDFDNRIKLINESNADFYLSIHLNYLSDTRYSGPQVFYIKNTKKFAEVIQSSMNNYLDGERKVKKIPSDTYMYKRISVPGILIECGFLSNRSERDLLIKKEYQKRVATAIKEGILLYY